MFIFSSFTSKKIWSTSKTLVSSFLFLFFAMKKEKKRKPRKGKHVTIMNESSETTFPNLPFTVFYKTRHPEKI